jgi:hypothetical protein
MHPSTMTTMNNASIITNRSRMQQQFMAAQVKQQSKSKVVKFTSAKQKQKQQEEEWEDQVAYLAAAVLAIVLTLTCPGHTDLWIPTVATTTVDTASESASSSTSISTLNWLLLTRAVVSYVVTIITYVRLQGSDPGYLNADMLNNLGDGYNSRGEKITAAAAAETEKAEAAAQHDMPAERMGERMVSVSGKFESTASPASSLSVVPKTSMTRRFRRTVPAGGAVLVARDDDNNDDEKQNKNAAAETVTPVVGVPIVVSDVHPQYYSSTRRKFCRTCQWAPPLRAHHCQTCRKCVATFDHHCDFVGTCIGERNRCRFWWFLAAQAVSLTQSLALVQSSSISIDYHSFFHTTTTTTSVSSSSLSSGWAARFCTWAARFCTWKVLHVVIAKLYLYPLTAAAVAMLCIHTVWALGNTTTFEWSRSKHLEYLPGFRPVARDWPFSRTIRQNLCLFCLGVPSSSRSDDDTDNNDDKCQPPKAAGVGNSSATTSSSSSSLSLSSSSSRSKKTTTAWKPTVWQPPRRRSGGGKLGGGRKHPPAVPIEKKSPFD